MALKEIIKRVDEKLGSPVRGMIEDRNQRQRMERFERDLQERRRKYQGRSFQTFPQKQVLDQINDQGFAHLKAAVNPQLVRQLYKEFEQHIDAATCLLPVSKDSARKTGDRDASNVYLSQEELSKGQKSFREHANNVALKEPMLNCATVIPLAFHDLLFDISCQYLDCVPAIGGMNLRKSYANSLAEFDTLYFHVDPNSPKFLKFFFYLNDVDLNGGPFCYVRGSHKKRFRGWQSKYRWSLDEMISHYGKDNVINMTANAGDILVADTNGFHRGTKVISSDRSMLTVDYVIHVEFEGKQEPFKISNADFQKLSEKQKAACDFLAHS